MANERAAIETIFDGAGCVGCFCVGRLLGADDVRIDADHPVVAASVIKVLVALEVEIRFAEQRLDPSMPVTLTEAHRTPGPVGFSQYADDVTTSLRDLVVAMLTISDNAATDALLGEVGLEAVNERAVQLGLTSTVLESDLATMIQNLVADAGCATFAELTSVDRPRHEVDALEQRIASSRALTPASTNRTTPRDMADLLRLIWTDRAGPPEACRRVRTLMGRQLTRARLASGFAPPVRVAAKSGGLMGVVRNEIGVIEFPDGAAYVAAVFTRALALGASDAAINQAIGSAAAVAVSALHGDRTGSPPG